MSVPDKVAAIAKELGATVREVGTNSSDLPALYARGVRGFVARQPLDHRKFRLVLPKRRKNSRYARYTHVLYVVDHLSVVGAEGGIELAVLTGEFHDLR
tara:strand:- start:42 stop:338 length:297 start_codon:yes stop_codon:yes gene_type:complete